MKGWTHKGGPFMSQVSSVAFCCGLSESCSLKESYSVYFYLRCGCSFLRGGSVFLKRMFSKESVMEAFLILVSFLGLLTIKSFTCLCDHPLFHYCSGMGSEQNWWKPWLPGADGLEGCQEGEWSVLPSQLFLDLLCCRVFSVSLDQLLHWKGTKLISMTLDGKELQRHC